jgi:hypothetical protein
MSAPGRLPNKHAFIAVEAIRHLVHCAVSTKRRETVTWNQHGVSIARVARIANGRAAPV